MSDIQNGNFVTFIEGPQLNRQPKTLRFSSYFVQKRENTYRFFDTYQTKLSFKGEFLSQLL